jgi:hypothetical protein
MRQVIKIILPAVAVVFGLLHSARAFSLAGPIGNGGDAWQVQNIGYGPPSDDVAPKNLGEEYRRNTSVLYYAYDQAFLDYFGSNGVVAVDGAFAIMNSLTNVSSYSADISEFPFDSRHVNFQAQALGLYDLKSFTLGELVRQMGLADPVQYTWTLHDRFLLPGTSCPAGEEYLVVQRNFDTGGSPIAGSPTVSTLYSPYVNDVLYSYDILEVCTGSPVLAHAVPFPVDPEDLLNTHSAVASLLKITWGDFYTGLTRDDVMGLRYLLQTNNINFESAAPGALLQTTNFSSTNIIQNFDLSVLLSAAFTNNPTALATLFPNLVIASVTTNFQTVCTPNIVSTIQNNTGSPIGSPPVFVVTTNGFNCVYQPTYAYSFANVITNSFSTNTTATNLTISVGQKIGAPIGTLATNITIKSITLTNTPSGSYFLIPTGECGLNININSGITNGVTTTTNILTTSTNANGFVDFEGIVTIFTNRQFLAQPVICGTVAGSTGLYQGIENVKFVKSSFDSLLGQFFQPITNNYTMVSVTNSQAKVQTFQRVVTAPDFLIDAQDLAAGGGALPIVPIFGVNINFDTANVLPGLAGPGTITPSTTLTFDKVGPVYFNTFADLTGTNYWLESPGGDTSGDEFYSAYFLWSSFDGTTNAPVVYPDGTSIANLENEVLIQVTPTRVSNGTKNVAYPATTFTATGGAFTPPFTWSATGLPSGLTVSSGGMLSGTPTQSGTFDFILQLTDSLARSVQFNYTITIQ